MLNHEVLAFHVDQRVFGCDPAASGAACTAAVCVKNVRPVRAVIYPPDLNALGAAPRELSSIPGAYFTRDRVVTLIASALDNCAMAHRP